jgi:predicted nucleotidyltransferase
MLHMVQKCSSIKVLEIFFQEPTSVHFIREIGKKINLAATSVRNNIKELEKMKLIQVNESRPFKGFVANRDSEKFLFYKKVYNFYTLYGLKEKLIEIFYPKAIIVFGSYSRGEDIETSDIDVLIISKVKKEVDLRRFEKDLRRKINLLIVNDLNNIDEKIQKKIRNGFTLYGEI